MRSNRRYDSEFKQEAVNLVVEDNRSIREVESSLGITHGVLMQYHIVEDGFFSTGLGMSYHF